MTEEVSKAVNGVLGGLDDHIKDYIASVLAEDPGQEVCKPCFPLGPLYVPVTSLPIRQNRLYVNEHEHLLCLQYWKKRAGVCVCVFCDSV